MGGYAGMIGYIDLGNGHASSRVLPPELRRDFIGGRGFTSKLIHDLVPPGIDALGPDNTVVLAVGPLAGTLAPSTGRITIGARSPLTGILGDGNAGGHVGAEMKYAGYDALVITGRAEHPTHVHVEDGTISFHDASDIWGAAVSETERMVRERCGDTEAHVISIGPAGENCVRYASLIADGSRAAARCGIGAVWGSKRLKALSLRGTGGVDIAHPEQFHEHVGETLEAIYADPVYPTLSERGTPFLIDSAQLGGGLATRNNQQGVADDYDAISCERFYTHHRKRSFACFACPIHCSNIAIATSADGRHITSEGPEYESIVCLGPKCGIMSLPAIIEANRACNELGLDTISCGSTIGFAMELWQRGIISARDTGGIDLAWGNEGSVLSLIEMIARREGYGDSLAEGVRRYTKRVGPAARPYALHVKGMEVPAFDGRAAKGFALGWAVSSRGADHLRALPNFELLGYPPSEAQQRFGDRHASDPYDERGKAELVTWHENFSAVVDSAEMCKYATFSTYAVTPGMLATLLHDVVGGHYDAEQLLRCGERIVTLERMIDISFGGTCRDTLPDRILHEPLPQGPARGNTVDLTSMVDRYYELRGWDRNGVPTADALKQLGLAPSPDGNARTRV